MCDVPVAGYQGIDTAGRDFDGLAGLVKEKKVQVEGVILVAHDQDGNNPRRLFRRQPCAAATANGPQPGDRAEVANPLRDLDEI